MVRENDANNTVSAENLRHYDHARLPIIRTISEQFELPQLIKTRRITALLPHDYEFSQRRYPVLYLQDGQNLFDDYAPYGNWAVDKRMAWLSARGMGDVIIIAIDHGGVERVREFTPSFPTSLGKGDGRQYVNFLTQTLKPFIDQHFRTLPERKYTGIGGSSMGGLISIYAGLMHPDSYSKLLIFSPSLWVAPNIHFNVIHYNNLPEMQVYLYGGAKESKNMIPNLHRFEQALKQQGQHHPINVRVSIDPHGEHNEYRWGLEFPKALAWLYFAQPLP